MAEKEFVKLVRLCEKLRLSKIPFSLIVQSESMLPVLQKGQIVSVLPIALTESINIGDIIVYRKFADHLTVHRIVNIEKVNDLNFYCETKGDNNSEIDAYKVFNEEIIGIVVTAREE